LLLTLVLLPFGAQDDEGKKTPPEGTPQLERDIFGRLRPRAEGEDSALDGVWQLLDVEVDGYPKEGMQAAGYMVIKDGHIAFQMEAFWEEDSYGEAPMDGYQAFVAEFERTGTTLACTTLLGAYLDEEEDEVLFETAGGKREFEITLNGTFLDLAWGETDVLTFGRRLSPTQRRLSIFGREKAGSGDADPDIFGRDRKIGDEEEGGDDKDGEGDGQ